MAASWESLQTQTLLTQRGKGILEYNDRVYVLEKQYKGRVKLSEYFRCANGCGAACMARVIRTTPLDGSQQPYVQRSSKHAHHFAGCNRNAASILNRRARQELVRVVVQSSAAGGASRSIRETFDSIGRIVQLHEGGCVSA